jgi:hypothetical protein
VIVLALSSESPRFSSALPASRMVRPARRVPVLVAAQRVMGVQVARPWVVKERPVPTPSQAALARAAPAGVVQQV